MNAIEVILVELVGLQHQANGKSGVDDVLVVITCVVPSFWEDRMVLLVSPWKRQMDEPSLLCCSERLLLA